MTAPTSCPNCGARVAPNDRFCGGCGADLSAAAKPVPGASAKPAPAREPIAEARAPSAGNLHKTMLGISPGQASAAAQAAAAAPAKPVPQRTMLGMSVPLVGGAQPQPSAEPRQAAPAPAATPLHKQTLMGVTPAMAAQLAAAGAAVDTRGSPREQAQAAPRAPAEAVAAAPSAPAADAAGQAPARTPAKLPAQSARTVLGITPPVAAPAAVPHTEPARAESFSAAPEPGRPRSFTPVSTPGFSSQEFASVSQQPAAPRAQRFLWLAVGALTVLALGGGVLAFLSTRGPELSVRVVNAGGSELLEVEAPGSAPDSKLRFLGVEQPLVAGRARFPLKADALTIGDNRLAIDLVAKDGAVASSSVQLAVAYRVRVDSAPLQATPPALDVVVDALPGSKVQLDAIPLALNERGYATRRYPVAPQAGGVLAFAVSYRIEAPGEKPADGKLELSLPVTSMQIDTPGAEVVTDQPVLEIAGPVEPDASVEVDGQSVNVIDGRFLHRAQLGEVGERVLKVIARAKGKAPRVAEIKVKRVQDLALAAASFAPDPALTYARIAQKPVIYRGQKVAFDGRVYHAEVEGGRSVLQMLVLDCPGQSRCPLWVEYPQATQVDLDSWVRVLGVVAGEQQFRSKQGQVHTVPSVNAQYVLKLAK